MLPRYARLGHILTLSLLFALACGGRVDLSGTTSPSAPSSNEDAGASAHDASLPSDTGAGDEAGDAMGDEAGSTLGFGPKQKLPYPEIGYPQSLAIGDVNGDGRNDVVLGNASTSVNQSNTLVFLQTSAGTFPSTPIAYPFGASTVHLADLNGDARTDIVFTTSSTSTTSSGMGVVLQRSDGTLGTPTIYKLTASWEYAVDVVPADFDGDGLTDVVLVVTGDPGNAYLYAQTNEGVLGPPKGFPIPGAGWSYAGDVNGDGLLDIVTLLDNGATYAAQLSILPLVAPGSFGTAYTADLGKDSCRSLAVGDVNGDGADDAVVAIARSQPDSKLLVSLQSTGKLLPPAKYDSFAAPEGLRIADVNADGRNDVVVVHVGWLAIGIYLQKSDGTLAQEVTLPSYYGSRVLDIGDVNGDGKPDIVTADQQALIVFYNEN